MRILIARRSTSGLFSPEISARIRPALRASERPMMSAKWKRFHSSPFGPHQTPPSVSTPSTSMAMALILRMRRAHPPQFVEDRLLPLEHAFHSIPHGLLD